MGGSACKTTDIAAKVPPDYSEDHDGRDERRLRCLNVDTCSFHSIEEEPLPTSYAYEPLDTTQRCIRLVKLSRNPRARPWSRKPNTRFYCTIETFDADDAPPYVALSYTWGDPTPTQTISLNGIDFIVRQNLYDFLKTFSKSKVARDQHIWIDQLCIDQTNTQERNHQVTLMPQIYRDSQFVVAWLDRSSYAAARKLKIGRWWYMGQYAVELLENRYFQRLWVIQEQLLAPKLYFVCRDVWLSWNKIRRGVMQIPLQRFETLPNAKWLFHGKRVKPKARRERYLKLCAEGLPLYDCVMQYSPLECEDRRDKIYGLLGLVRHSVENIAVDYDRPLKLVYVDAVKFLLSNPGPRSLDRAVYDAKTLANNMLGQEHERVLKSFFDDIKALGNGFRGEIGVEQTSFGPDQLWFEHNGRRHSYSY